MKESDTKKYLLDDISSPDKIKNLTKEELEQLSQEIRDFLINSISKTGGHLSSNLGVVELTLAIHKSFNSPDDKIVWDVGHQCYTHKILTGRKDKFEGLRKKDGISGFPKSKESEHDAFIGGHSSNSISAGYGIATAIKSKGNQNYTVVVIGDGSYTGGMVYEAMNNIGRTNSKLIVILNHNDMSISKNVGAFSKYLMSIRSKPHYIGFKKFSEKVLDRIPYFGKNIKRGIRIYKTSLKKALYKNTFFEEMGFEYMGPVDGHSIDELVDTLNHSKTFDKPVLIHVETKKGKGYDFAEQNPGAYHGVSTFDVTKINPDATLNESYSNTFGKELGELSSKDDTIFAVTAAMKYGTGLQHFKRNSNFFDVGIAEQHATTFCAGLASQGMKPVFAVYSSFLQRGYDQIIHDCAIEKQHVVFAIDRAGIVGDDGETHQGVFDVGFLSSIPNTTIYSPESYSELKDFLYKSLYETESVVGLRYPRGKEEITHNFIAKNKEDFLYTGKKSNSIAITYGRITENMVNAVKDCKKNTGKTIDMIKLLKIHPISQEVLDILKNYEKIYFFEETLKKGSIAKSVMCDLYENDFTGKMKIYAIKDEFIKQGLIPDVLKIYGLDKDSMYNTLISEGE